MTKTPSAIWVVDAKREHLAINEATKLGIPVIGILDTNADPDEFQYPIPGNDDAIRSVGLLTRIIADAAAEGLIQRHQNPTDESAEPPSRSPTGSASCSSRAPPSSRRRDRRRGRRSRLTAAEGIEVAEADVAEIVDRGRRRRRGRATSRPTSPRPTVEADAEAADE